MTGLIKNDFLTMKRVILLYVAVLVVYYLLGVFGNGMAGVQIFAVFFCTMLVISCFSAEERCGWNRYVNVLPVSRTQIVVSKYLFAVICMFAASGGGALVQVGMNLLKELPVADGLWVSAAAASAASLFLAVIMPVLFQFGPEKSRVLLVLIFLVPFFTAMLIEKTGIKVEITMETLTKLLPLAVLGAGVLVVLSCMVSVRIYRRKEF